MANTIVNRYYCGYQLNLNKTAMIHIRQDGSDRINLYDKVNINDKFELKNILKEIISLALCDYTPKICGLPNENKDEDVTTTPVALVWQDNFGIYRIRLEQNNDAIGYKIQSIANSEQINAKDIVGRSLGECLNLNWDTFPRAVKFAKHEPTSTISHSLAEYYINNESLIIELVY